MFPPTSGVRWFNVFILTATPAIAIYGLFNAPFNRRTLWFAAVYYVFTMLGKYQLMHSGLFFLTNARVCSFLRHHSRYVFFENY